MKKSMIGKFGVCLFSLFVATTVGVKAQDKLDASVGADLVSAYEWRGQDLGGAAAQPYAGISYKGLTLGAWGSVGLDKSNSYTSELDFTVGYTSGKFSAAVTDYYSLVNANFGDVKYFKYGSSSASTAHVYEATIGYNFGPLALAWNTNFAGNDGTKSDDKRAYSTYIQATAPFKVGAVDFKAELGVSPWETSYYVNSSFAVVNIGVTATKQVKIADFTLPVYAKIGANPDTQRAFVVLGVTL
ncbi:MAG: hypothetical protein H6Q14_453 [Bacteroidetes bacterium]|nr:hypothetical protein [Bacteroidota bacterium]